MSSEGKIVVRTGSGTLTTIGVVFIVLKLVNVIDWSWWIVTLPFWGPVAAGLLLLVLIAIIAGI